MKASAPASSANLGHGFDTLALALDLRCEVITSPAEAWEISSGDPDFIHELATELTDQPQRVAVHSGIPIGKGLGSSAAIAAAVAAALRPEWCATDRMELFRFVAEKEGHPDNAAAAVFGGLVSVVGEDRVLELEMHPVFRVVLAMPDATLPTSEARAAIPAEVPIDLAARTAARAIMLIEALRSGDTQLLASIGADELHEPHRAALRPIIHELIDAAVSAGAPLAVISGAGPSVLALVTERERDGVVAALNGRIGEGRVEELSVDRRGVVIN